MQSKQQKYSCPTPVNGSGIFIGVDIGNFGGIAFLDRDARILRVERMPIKKDTRGKQKVDPNALYRILSWVRPVDLLAMEHCQPHGRDKTRGSRVSLFGFGNNVGRTQAIVHLLGIPFVEPTPQLWKKRLLEGTAKDKAAAIAYCNARWPGACQDRDGLADALLLAEYARLTSRGE